MPLLGLHHDNHVGGAEFQAGNLEKAVSNVHTAILVAFSGNYTMKPLMDY
jgi:hypothetical protein